MHEKWERKKTLNPIYVCCDRYGNVMKPDVVTHNFQKFLKENGLRHIRFHDLRHPYVKHTTKNISTRAEIPAITELDNCRFLVLALPKELPYDFVKRGKRNDVRTW